jgi:hypothetical protein
MRIKVLAFAVLFLLISSSSAGIPQTPSTTTSAPQRDPQAVALLQKSVSVMGVPPSDSTATGKATTAAGSLTQQGSVTILTRGSAQTSVQFQMPNDLWTVVFASGQANKVETAQTTVYPLELAASSQCLYFPLPFLSGILNNTDYSVQYMGQETVDSSTANHIVVQNTFNSTPTYQFLSSFTVADIWIDASSGLPIKIAMIRRDGGGSAPKIPISVVYSNYQPVSGVRYPFTIQEYITDTLWATTTIQSVSFNTGLSDTSFSVVQGGN